MAMALAAALASGTFKSQIWGTFALSRAAGLSLLPAAGSGEGKAGGRVQERGPWILIFWKKGGCGSEEGMWMECPRLVGRRGGLGRGFSFVIGLHSYWCADNRKCNSLF